MENYIVSARKYRPSTFDTVVGQSSLTTTLKNAIATNKLAHAYLFCGPRGVGKTTCARIFAKTINCTDKTKDGEACDKCESCVSFNENRSYNIHELDAASNNSVDDIRSLVEQVRIQPQIGKYKVYIIDEVHMLSTSAFNAFLKTLEEPPKHAIFILATTEKHKILPTILSRCQIYDFNRITIEDTINHLASVAEKENVSYEREALNIIALKSDGGMRDALSIFDQIVSYTGGNITYKGTIENLNVLDYEYYFSIVDSLMSKKVGEALLTFNEILNKGFDGGHFITGLSSHFRDLLVSKDEATTTLLEVGASIKERYIEQAKKCNSSFIFKALKLCNDCDMNYKNSKNKRLLVELTLIQISQIEEGTSDDSSGGLVPNKKLNPVFNNNNPKQEAKVAHNSTTDINQKQESKEETSKVQTNNAENRIKVNAPTNTVTNNISRYSTSIKQMMQQEDTKTKQNNEIKTENITTEENDYELKDVVYYWNDLAQKMPIEHKATAKRMEASPPISTQDKNSFEVILENEMVMKDFILLKSKIENYIKNKLRNKNFNINFKIRDKEKPLVKFSKKERLESMLERSFALKTLYDELNLKLDI